MPISNVPTLPGDIAIVDPATGYPTTIFIRWWQDNIAGSLNSLIAAQNAQTAADAANAAAAVATTAAASAQTTADAAGAGGAAAQASADAAAATAAANAKESAIVNSGTTGITLTAADAGTNVTVTISAHTRVYGDGTSVSVAGGTVTGLPYSSVARIYYDQPSRAGGTVTYQATIDPAAGPVQGGDRHSVGAVTTPAAAAPPVSGRPLRQPGFVEP